MSRPSAQHRRVQQAHVYGRLVVHDDPAWVEAVVRRLTDTHENRQPQPWTV